jgi:glycosyltransferase domain-containing protein
MDLTVVIPTHNRHKNILKSIKYYSNWNCNVFILDSSDIPIYFDSTPNIKYLHTPDLSFTRKIYNGLCNVKTSYVCLCADDDYLAFNGIIDGIFFLDHNFDYVSVQGKYVQFTITGKDVLCFPLYESLLTGMHISSENIRERLIQAAKNGMQQIYSLHRINVLKETFSIIDDLFSFAEFNSNLVPMFIGKHYVIDSFWMARDSFEHSDYKKLSWGSSSAGKINYLNSLLEFLQKDNLGKIYKDKFVHTLNRFSKIGIDESELLFEEIYFKIYLNGSYLNLPINTKISLVTFLKMRLTFFLNLFCPNFIYKLKKMKNKFPYRKNLNSNKDWKIIKQHLLTN